MMAMFWVNVNRNGNMRRTDSNNPRRRQRRVARCQCPFLKKRKRRLLYIFMLVKTVVKNIWLYFACFGLVVAVWNAEIPCRWFETSKLLRENKSFDPHVKKAGDPSDTSQFNGENSYYQNDTVARGMRSLFLYTNSRILHKCDVLVLKLIFFSSFLNIPMSKPRIITRNSSSSSEILSDNLYQYYNLMNNYQCFSKCNITSRALGGTHTEAEF